MIYQKLLELKAEIESQCGKIVRITFDKKGNEAFRDELDASVSCSRMLFGIIIDQVKECPTCGHILEMEKKWQKKTKIQ